MLRAAVVAAAVLASVSSVAVLPASAAGDQEQAREQAREMMLAALPAVPCDPKGETQEDARIAAELRPKMRVKMRAGVSAYNVSCARVIVKTIQDRGFSKRAAEIAMATVIVESDLRNVTGGHDDSVGLYQQRKFWGSYEQRMDPVWATNAFLNEMQRLFPNNSWTSLPIGQVAADVQRPRSDLKGEYAKQTEDAVTIANALWDHRTRGNPGTDVSGDGFADVLATTRDGKLWYYPNNIKSPGNNGLPFGPGYSVSFDNSMWHTHQRVVAGDVSGDGHADLLATSSDGTLWCYMNGIIYTGHPFEKAVAVGGPDWKEDKFRLVAAADVTGDGYADALAVDADGKLWYFPNNINGPEHKPFGGGVAIGGDWRGFTRIIAADVSGDGYADILATDANGDLWYYVNGIVVNKGVPFTSGTKIGSGWNWMGGVAAGDYSGDGHADLVGVDLDGKLWYYPNNSKSDPNGIPFTTRVETPGSDWRGYDRIL
nr:hypothetical protein GCM10020241_34750 [Streptoalloteichus tenebrarius]